MSDRRQLEKAEARELVASFWMHDKKGREVAKEFLAKRIKYLTKFYGNGFDERVRAYMREITKDELGGKRI